MRWLALLTAFFLICFISLLLFIWTWRAELLARAIDLSLKNCTTRVESVSALSLTSYVLKNIQIETKENSEESESLKIDQIVLEFRTSELLSWMFLPLRDPLVVENATIVIASTGNQRLISSSDQPVLFIGKLEAILPSGQRIALGEQKGTPGSILASVLQTIQNDKSVEYNAIYQK